MPIVLSIDGTPIARPAANVVLGSLLAYQKDGVPTLSFARRGIVPPLRPDPYLGRSVALAIDGTVRFSGDVCSCLHHLDEHLGWVAEYQCLGLRYRGDLVPVVNDQTGGDWIAFNLPADDPGYIASRAGRTLGQMLVAVLEGVGNSAALAGYGIGAYVAAAGSGASATASLLSGGVSAIDVDDAGSGYTAAPNVLLAGGDGSGATAHAVLGTGPDAGQVTAIVVDAPGSGYTSPPEVLVSRLPLATLQDLSALDVVPPHRVAFGGDRLLDALEGPLRQLHPNHCLHVEPDTGALRFLDLRSFAPVTLTLGVDPVRPPRLAADVSQCYQRVELRGEPLVEPAELSLAAGSLEESFGHDGLSNQAAKNAWKYADFNQPAGTTGAAQATAALTPTTVDTALVLAGGTGYTSAPTVGVAGGGGSGATFTAQIAGGQVTGLTRTNAGTGYTSAPTLTISGGGGSGAKAIAVLVGTSVASLTLTDGGYAYAAAPAVAIVPTPIPTAVASVTVTAGGTGYTTPPAVSFSGGNGSGAAATAVLGTGGTAGQVVSVTVTSGGTGYTYPPRVVLSGGGGSGARATAALLGTVGGGTGATATATLAGTSVGSLALSAGGSGYRLAPTVHVGGPVTPATDYGTCDPASNTTLSVRVRSDDATRAWGANAWDQATGRKGVLVLYDSITDGVDAYTTRRVVANTALLAGGTCDLTVDLPLPGTGYDRYALYGEAGGGSVVWRRYRPTDPAVRAAMTGERFSYPFAYMSSDGLAAQLVSYPVGTVLYSPSGAAPFAAAPIAFDADPTDGTILTQQPVVTLFGTPTALAQGGSFTDGIPSDVRFLVGLYKGDLQVSLPESGYEGTSHAVEGLGRTLAICVSGWRDPGQSAAMERLAREHLDSVKDTVLEGELEYLGLWAAGLAFGVAVQVAGTGYTTGLEAIPLPVVGLTVEFHETGGPSLWTTSLRLSNRRGRYSAESFLVPQQTGLQWGLAYGSDSVALGGPMGGQHSPATIGEALATAPVLGQTPFTGGRNVAFAGGRDVEFTGGRNVDIFEDLR